jgi:hypothetical protein
MKPLRSAPDSVHRSHDELLVVRLASGDADAVDRAAADPQLAACMECRALLADVTAIRASTTASSLPVPPRPRSLRLTPEQLERGARGGWRRWLADLGAPRFDVLRPLGTGVAALGLVAVALGSVQPLAQGVALFGAPAAAPAPGEVRTDAEGGDMQGRDTLSPALGPEPIVPEQPVPGEEREFDKVAAEAPQPLPVVPIGALVLASGMAILVVHSAARRAAGR